MSLNGNFVALELKSSTGELSPLQKYNLDTVRKSGGYGFVGTPENWESLAERLDKIARGEE